MNEQKWLTTTRPYLLTSHIESGASSRKLRLLAVACCYRIRDKLMERQWWQAVEAAERFADGLIDAVTLRVANAAAERLGNEGVAVITCSSRDGFHIHLVHAHAAAAARRATERKAQSDLVRDLFGNPFRPVAFDPSWRTDAAVSLAKGMYESRDFGAMPILADALQDAGCDSDDILDHCRDAKQTHVRGCWVVDLVLGKD
jgi:hypothetical protein